MIKVTIKEMTLEIPDSTGLLQAIAGNIVMQATDVPNMVPTKDHAQQVTRSEEAPAYETNMKSKNDEAKSTTATGEGTLKKPEEPVEMEVLSLETLKKKHKPEIVEIAKAMGLEFTSKTTKDELIALVLGTAEETAVDLDAKNETPAETPAETSAKEWTKDDVRAELTKVQEAGIPIAPIIKSFNAKNLSSLDPKDYEAVIAKAKAELAKL